VKRDLQRERAIAKALGPLKVWSPTPERRPARLTARDTLAWLRQAEREREELNNSPDADHSSDIGPEFN
jgi:hypothetical protein